jgi:hypothetical protein
MESEMKIEIQNLIKWKLLLALLIFGIPIVIARPYIYCYVPSETISFGDYTINLYPTYCENVYKEQVGVVLCDILSGNKVTISTGILYKNKILSRMGEIEKLYDEMKKDSRIRIWRYKKDDEKKKITLIAFLIGNPFEFENRINEIMNSSSVIRELMKEHPNSKVIYNPVDINASLVDNGKELAELHFRCNYPELYINGTYIPIGSVMKREALPNF